MIRIPHLKDCPGIPFEKLNKTAKPLRKICIPVGIETGDVLYTVTEGTKLKLS
jgi:hypothetical protein